MSWVSKNGEEACLVLSGDCGHLTEARECAEGGAMSRRKRRGFTDEQRAAAVEQVRQTGKTVYQAARDLDLTQTALLSTPRWTQVVARAAS